MTETPDTLTPNEYRVLADELTATPNPSVVILNRAYLALLAAAEERAQHPFDLRIIHRMVDDRPILRRWKRDILETIESRLDALGEKP